MSPPPTGLHRALQPASLRMRLLTSLVASLVAVFFLLWLVVSESIRSLTMSYLEDRIELEIESILTEMSLDDRDAIQLNTAHVDALFRFAFSGYYYQIRLFGQGVDQTLRSRSLEEHRLQIPQLPVGRQERFTSRGPGGEKLLVVARALPLRELTLTIAVAEDLTPMEEDLEAFQLHYSIISLLFVLLLGVGHVWTVHRAMGPVDRIHRELKELEAGRIQQLTTTVPSEMADLVAQVNRLQGVMAQQLDRSRSAIANLAHALKTPLAALIQMTTHPVIQGDPQLKRDLEERTRLLHGLVERELRRARLADRARPGSFFAPQTALPPLLRTLKSIHYQKRVEVTTLWPPALLLPYDQEDMLEVLGNLLDNAFKWTTSRIHLAVDPRKEGLWITVEDDGPGLGADPPPTAEGQVPPLDEFAQGEHGLGLLIAREIVTHYGGTLSLLPSPTLGGLLVKVHFPS